MKEIIEFLSTSMLTEGTCWIWLVSNIMSFIVLTIVYIALLIESCIDDLAETICLGFIGYVAMLALCYIFSIIAIVIIAGFTIYGIIYYLVHRKGINEEIKDWSSQFKKKPKSFKPMTEVERYKNKLSCKT